MCSHWPRFFDRNQAITALTINGLLESGRQSDAPVVRRSGRSWHVRPAHHGYDRVAVATVAAVAAVITYRHAYELVSTHGESGVTARLMPFTVDGLILAASMLNLDVNRRQQPVPTRWCLGAGIAATSGANLLHGLGHGPVGALVSGLPALALAGSFELLMTLARTERGQHAEVAPAHTRSWSPCGTGTAAGDEPGANGAGLARSRSQPALHRPRDQRRPP